VVSKPIKPKKNDIVPGQMLVVRPGTVLPLNPHDMLMTGKCVGLEAGEELTIVRGPHKLMGINLVTIQLVDLSQYECFYIQTLQCCYVK
jgi:hypothetical protein